MKYKLGEKHPELNLYRIVALKDFGDGWRIACVY